MPRGKRNPPPNENTTLERAGAAVELIEQSGATLTYETEDQQGVVWRRYEEPNGDAFVLFATPFGWEIFVPVVARPTLDRVREAIGVGRGAPFPKLAAAPALRATNSDDDAPGDPKGAHGST
jgi:hypothetical protein